MLYCPAQLGTLWHHGQTELAVAVFCCHQAKKMHILLVSKTSPQKIGHEEEHIAAEQGGLEQHSRQTGERMGAWLLSKNHANRLHRTLHAKRIAGRLDPCQK